MKKVIFMILLVTVIPGLKLSSQPSSDTSVYLITCGPGTETYSIYGHSALRIISPDGRDLVYNWGVFDFSTPHFAYKFAKGRLEYMLDTEPFNRFLQIYLFEQRWVKIQKINLTSREISVLMSLISENLKPGNVGYRYDFFYDDCSTRIRDLLEKTLGANLLYTPSAEKIKPSFRFLTGTYQQNYPWLDFGIDLLMGTPSDKKASDRESMFLPLNMQQELSDALINRGGRMVPLLQNPETVLDYPTQAKKTRYVTHPVLIFAILCIAVIIFSANFRSGKIVRVTDIVIFSIFSLLAVLMLFSNFFTDHEQMKKNLALLWLSPFLLICLAAIIFKKPWVIWFRIVFFLTSVSFAIQIIFPSAGNSAFLPLIVIIWIRSSVRAGISMNPLSLKSF